MRAVLLILMVVVVAALIAIKTGFWQVYQTQPAQLPGVSVNGTTVTAHGGQPPAFEVQTGSVGVGTGPANVTVPQVEIKPGTAQVNVPKIEVTRPTPPQPQGQPQPANQAAR
ncbi:hypothetical protein ABDK56_06970 [Sphingomonas sp. ASV193]|uniref:hypothetical protein n=1 Tax=Sphingomonas sp. ASV193 TaxID=3144405 RepID=UPI0032E90DF6